ncbi:MAG: YraN family protein [Paracoccaceae bacterium]
MSSRNYQSGLAAEDIATRHYTAMGATLLATRWRSKAGEIDLIFTHGPTVVFVEVKARRTHDSAAESLAPRQIARLLAAAEIYLATQCPPNQNARFDLALVNRAGGLEILQNCFQ